MSEMGRRNFIALLGGAAAWALAARTQQPGKIPCIGIIDDAPRWTPCHAVTAYRADAGTYLCTADMAYRDTTAWLGM
jgi:hypothetical protein